MLISERNEWRVKMAEAEKSPVSRSSDAGVGRRRRCEEGQNRRAIHRAGGEQPWSTSCRARRLLAGDRAPAEMSTSPHHDKKVAKYGPRPHLWKGLVDNRNVLEIVPAPYCRKSLWYDGEKSEEISRAERLAFPARVASSII